LQVSDGQVWSNTASAAVTIVNPSHTAPDHTGYDPFSDLAHHQNGFLLA
jgi:hypothetical protein